MSSKFFYPATVRKNKNSVIYTDDFVEYKVVEFLYENQTATLSEILKSLNSVYENDGIIRIKLRDYLDVHFLKEEDTIEPQGNKELCDLEITIDKLNFSVRTYNCLKRAKINSLREIIESSENEIKKIRNLGITSLKEVIDKVKSLGLSLRDENQYMSNRNTLYLLSENQKYSFIQTMMFKKNISNYKHVSIDELYQEVVNYIGEEDFDLTTPLGISLFLNYINDSEKDIYYYTSLYYKIISSTIQNNKKISNDIRTVSRFYDKLQVKNIAKSKIELEFLFAAGVNSMLDLKKISNSSLICIFAKNLDEFMQTIEEFGNAINPYERELKKYKNLLSEKELFVLSNRFGFDGEKALTLEEIGDLYKGVTRERIRQIEAKSLRKLRESFNKNIIYCTYDQIVKPNENYIEIDRLINYLEGSEIVNFIILALKLFDLEIRYDSDLKVIYNVEYITKEDIISDILCKLGNVISSEKIESLNSLEKSVVKYEYKDYKNGFKVKKTLTEKELLIEVMTEHFPDGFRVYDDEQYEKLMEKYIDKFGEMDFPSQRTVQAMIERGNCGMVNKGTYLNKDFCATLDDELLNKIRDFISLNKPMVFYVTIFEHFKSELERHGIDNHYYLKGCLDEKLGNEFKNKRDYIMVGDEQISSYEAILNAIRSFDNEFSIEDLRVLFKGVKDYTFYNTLYSEIKNGLIWTSSGTFRYINQNDISLSTKDELKQFIENLFTQIDTPVLSARKIYAKLSFLNKELLEGLKICTNQFSLFSLIKYLFNDYYYSRPLISKREDFGGSSYSLIKEHVRKFEKFNMLTIQSYIAKMNIGGLYSYLQFMEDMSDEYVQINVDTMVKKETADISQEDLNRIKGMLNLILGKFEKIDTKQFDGYSMLPKLCYNWNKYLLVGIIRSYLDENLEVVNTETMYTHTDYVIRRI